MKWLSNINYLGDDEWLFVLQAALHGEAPRRSSLQPGLYQHPAASSSISARRLLEPRPAAALHAQPGSAHSGLLWPQPGSGPADSGWGNRNVENNISFTSAFPPFIYNSSLRKQIAEGESRGVRAPSCVSCKVHSWSAESGWSSGSRHTPTPPRLSAGLWRGAQKV